MTLKKQNKTKQGQLGFVSSELTGCVNTLASTPAVARLMFPLLHLVS